MADAGNLKADETARLEAALERIARAKLSFTDAPPTSSHQSGSAPPGNAVGRQAELAHRLDLLIAELRTVLGRDSGD